MKTYSLNNNNELVPVSSYPDLGSGIPNGRQPSVTVSLSCSEVQPYLNRLNHNLGGAVTINLTDSNTTDELVIEGFTGTGIVIIVGKASSQTYSSISVLNNNATIELQNLFNTARVEVHRSECNIIGGNATNVVLQHSSSVLIQNVYIHSLSVAIGCTAYITGDTYIENNIINSGTIIESNSLDTPLTGKVRNGILIDEHDVKLDDTYMRSDFEKHTDIGNNGAITVIASDGTGSTNYTVQNINRMQKGGVKVVYGHVQGTISGLAGGAIPVIRLREDYAHNYQNEAICLLNGQTSSDTIVVGRCYNNTDIRWGEVTGGYITGYNGAFNISFSFTTMVK
jgi:hypothetical protein